MILHKTPGPPGGPGAITKIVRRKVFKPLCGIYHGMPGTVENTNQDYVIQTVQGGDAPAPETQNRGALAGSGGQTPQEYEIVGRDIAAGLYSDIVVDGHNVRIATIDLSPLYFAGEPGDKPEFHDLVISLMKYYHLEPVEVLILNPDAETYVTCKDNNLICYLLREICPECEDQVYNVRESSLAKEIPAISVSFDDFPEFKTAEILSIDIHNVEKIALAAARYAIEQLNIDYPIIVIITEGYMNAIVIAKRGDEA